MSLFKKYFSAFYASHRDLVNISLLVLLTFLVFNNSLNSYFLEVDDFNSMLHSERSISQSFITNTDGYNSGGNYRPLEVLSHQFDRYVYGENETFGRHLTNLLIHILNVIFIYISASFLTKKKLVGLSAGLFFSVLIIHSYSLSPVTWISGRVDLFVTFFYLLTLILFIWSCLTGSILIYIASFITFILALWSKEMAVTLPFMALLLVLKFPEFQKDNGTIKIKLMVPFFKLGILTGVLVIIAGLFFNPNFIREYLSPDNRIEQHTIERIQFLQRVVFISGVFCIIVSSFILAIFKYSKNATSKIKSVRYSLPYFAILIYYFFVRYIVLGNVGGLYKSYSGDAVFFDVKVDTFLRDIYGMTGLIWPAGINFNTDVLNFQINHVFFFYTLSFILLIGLVLILIKLKTSKQKILSYSYLWIFITMLPVHNILIAPWYYNQRYLYLPSVGFCILISILIYNLIEKRKNSFRSMKMFIIIFFLSVIAINSMLIYKHNEELVKNGKMIENLIGDLKKYKSKISDSTKIVFITWPLSSVTTKSAVFIHPYMGEILGFIKSYQSDYNYDFILFTQNKEQNNVNVNWLDEWNLIVDGIDLAGSMLVPQDLSATDKQIVKRYGRRQPHPLMLPLPLAGDIKEVNGNIIKVLKIYNRSNKAKLGIELKGSANRSIKNQLIFIYRDGHLELVKEVIMPINTPKYLDNSIQRDL
jgi:hypothetical protein